MTLAPARFTRAAYARFAIQRGGMARSFGLLLGLTLVASCGGKGGSALVPAHPALLPAESNRDRLLGQIVLGNLDRTLGTADTLRGQGILPFGGPELRQMLVARIGVAQELFDLIDTAQPIALALVAPAATPSTGTQSSPPPHVAGVFQLRAPALAAAAQKLASVGTLAESRKDAQRFTRKDGTSFWLLRVGTQVLWSDAYESLAQAGGHALAAKLTPDAQTVGTTATDDLVATFFPGAFTRKDVRGLEAVRKDALAAYEAQLRETGRGAAPPAERASIEAGLDFALLPMSETERMRIGIAIDGERGIAVGLRALPIPGTTFAKRTGQRAVHSLPALQSGAQPVGVVSLGAMPSLVTLGQGVLDRQAAAAVPGAAAIATRLRALAPLLSGAVYQGTRLNGDSLGLDWVVGLAPSAAPAAALSALQALAADPALPVLLQQVWGRDPVGIACKPVGQRLEIAFTFPQSGRPGSPAAIARAFSGSHVLTVLAEAHPGRIVLSADPGAGARLAALGAPAPAAVTSPEGSAFAVASAEAAGREGLVYLDVWGLARPILRASLAGNQRRFMDMVLSIPGLSTLSLPVWLSLDGGKALAADLRVPIVTLKNASALLALVGGAGGGGLEPLP